MRNTLEKTGSFGSIVAAAACPVCFPKLALLGAIFGMGTLAKYETAFFIAAHVLVVLAMVGHVVSYKRHHNRALLTLAGGSVALFFISLYVFGVELLTYMAFAGLITATVWLMFENRRCQSCDPASPTSISPE